MTAPWTHDPRVVALLASCAANAPAVAFIDPLLRSTRDETAWTGQRVDQLQALWNELAEPVLTRCQATGDYDPWVAFCFEQPDVQEAISAAVEAAADVRRAA